MKTRRLSLAILMLMISAILLTTASFAWFSMNTEVRVTGIEVEAYSDSIFIKISQNKDSGYDFTTAVKASDKAVRPVTGVRLESGAVTIEATQVSDDVRYSSAKSSIASLNYYLKEKTGKNNDTYEGDNYILVNDRLKDASPVAGYYNFSSDHISFDVVSLSGKYDGTGTYYRKEGNSYRKLVENTDSVFEEYELEVGESELRGLYTVTLGTPEGDGAVYDGSSYYYEEREDGFYPVGGLSLGTLLKEFYTLEISDPISTADGTSKYYVENSRGDLVCIGTPEKDTNLEDYFYWARTYSSSVTASEPDNNTLNVIKKDYLESYYYHDTFYIRTAEDTDTAKNLRVSGVTVEGEDSLSNAIRVLFVATNGEGEVSRAVYNNRKGSTEHWDSDDGKILFEEILGNGEETVEIEVYIYFDGTDASVKTKDSMLSGSKITLEFAVDEQDYAV